MIVQTPKERPMLMHARSIKGILEGRKTQTRRIVKRNPPFECDGCFEWYPGGREAGFHASNGDSPRFSVPSGWAADYCPFGMPGDRLWVRETWYCDHFKVQSGPFLEVEDSKKLLYYRADVPSGRFEDADEWGEPGSHWKPSIHMPRWASRLTLEITGIRVERVHDISEEDCIAEGLQRQEMPKSAPCGQFRELWDDTNGKGAWARNDWVWVVGFKGIGD